MLELEGLTLGVTGKVALWIVLNENYGQDPRLSGVADRRESGATITGAGRPGEAVPGA